MSNRQLYLAWALLIVILPATVSAAARDADHQAEAAAKQPLAAPTGELPWNRQPAKVPGRQVQGAKEYLQLLGVDASQWRNLFHDQPLGQADEEWINRILYQLPRIPGEQLHRWQKTDGKFTEIAAAPNQFQGDVLLLRGRAKHCERVPLVRELVERYEFDHYYRVHIALDDGHTAIVCARAVPLAWKDKQDLDERVETQAIFLKTSPVDSGPPQLVCASLRVAWLPEQPVAASHITADSVLLANHGFDFGLWDQLRGHQKRGLEDADREPFFQLLNIMQKLDPRTPELLAAPLIDIYSAVRTPEGQTGALVTVEGTVKRIDRIELLDTDVRTRFGLDHYFQLFVFVPLKQGGIKLQQNPKDPEPRIFTDAFPVTICVPELPPNLQPSTTLQEHVRLHGVYFKVWTYHLSGKGAELGKLQPSPLVISPAVALVEEPDNAASPMTNIVTGLLFVSLLGFLAGTVWWMSRGDARFKRDVLQKTILGEDHVDLTGLKE